MNHPRHDEALSRMAEQVKDHVFDDYLSQVTPMVYEDMYQYYSLTPEDINDAIERVSLQQVKDVNDLLIEQEFVNSQVGYLNKIVAKVLKDL